VRLEQPSPAGQKGGAAAQMVDAVDADDRIERSALERLASACTDLVWVSRPALRAHPVPVRDGLFVEVDAHDLASRQARDVQSGTPEPTRHPGGERPVQRRGGRRTCGARSS
jgi:hypothetical protein